MVKTILRKKNGAGGIRLPDFRLYYKSIGIKTVWCWHKNRNIGQWNRTASSDINLHTDGNLIYNIRGKNIQQRNDSFFNKLCWDNWTTTCKRMKFRTFPNTTQK